MSEFSELLSLLIKTKDINVSALTNYCNLDRSSMYKLINGKRNPASREQVRKISEFINLNPMESQEMIEAYDIARVGWETYYRRKNVSEFILNFQEIQAKSSAGLSSAVLEHLSDLTIPDQGSQALNGRLQVTSSIYQILLRASSEANGSIYIISQPEHLEGLEIAASLLRNHSDTDIFHIICINNGRSYIRSQQDYNLQCLTKLIPFFGTQCNYHSYYYYDNVNSHFNNLNFMPCVFLTPTAAVICSSDMKDGILFRSENLISLLIHRFQIMLKETSPLILSFRSTLEFHLKTFRSVMPGSREAYGLAAQPCLIPFISNSLLKKYASEELHNRPELIETLQKYISTFSDFLLHNFFSRSGILQFLKTGRMHEIPDKLYRPFEYPDRINILKLCLKALKDGKNIRLFQPPLDRFPENLHIFSSGDFGYILFSSHDNTLHYLLLKEQNLLNAFCDFSSALEESELLCSADETAAFLQKLIE